MSSHEATTSKSISKTKSKSVNSLVHEVQDNFEFEVIQLLKAVCLSINSFHLFFNSHLVRK
jgi:hypothetical protein